MTNSYELTCFPMGYYYQQSLSNTCTQQITNAQQNIQQSVVNALGIASATSLPVINGLSTGGSYTYGYSGDANAWEPVGRLVDGLKSITNNDAMAEAARREGRKMLNITKVETFNGKVVKCTFADGKWEKAVCSDNDVFDLETGILLCIAKHAMGGQTKLYNQVRKGVKVYEKAMADKAAAQERKAKIERKRAEKAEKARQKNERLVEWIAQKVREVK